MKRLLSILLVVSMIASLLCTTALGVNYVDTDGHWAEEAIDYWSSVGILTGFEDNTFDPDGPLTRAQAATIFSRLLKLEKRANLSMYTDCIQGEWYYDAISKCVAAGIMNGVTSTSMAPNEPVTRAMLFTMFCRAMGIEGQSYTRYRYNDSHHVPSWAEDSVNALLNLGYVNGVTSTTLEPLSVMTRAAFLTLIDNAVAVYVVDGGEVEVKGDGIVLIVTDEEVEVSGEFSGTIVATQEDTSISLENLKGEVEVVAAADNIFVFNAPVGTKVTSYNGAQNIVVNDIKVDKNDSEIVTEPEKEETPSTPVIPDIPFVPTCSHNGTYTYVENAQLPAHDVYCDLCDELIDTVWCNTFTYTEPTCAKAGTRTCVHCGCTYDDKPATGEHVDEVDDNKCDVCGTALCANDDHKWGEPVVVKAATCTEAGSSTETCSACGSTKTETIPATDHAWGEYKVTTEPTCSVAGEETRTCANDSSHTESRPVNALGCPTDKNKDGLCDYCVKFYLGVSSKANESAEPTTVSATVRDDYSIEINGVTGSATVNTNNVSATVIMQNVDSLDAEYKKHTLGIDDTGMGSMELGLGVALKNCISFAGATVNVNVQGSTPFAYKFSENTNGTITAKPDDVGNARAAWQQLTSHVTTTPQDYDDSYAIIRPGSFIQIGSEILYFESAELEPTYLKVDDLSDMTGLQAEVRKYMTLGMTNTNSVRFYAAANSVLALGQSVATLNDSTLITIGGNNITFSNTILSDLKACTTTKDIVRNLVFALDAVIGAVNGGTVNVDVSFCNQDLPHICENVEAVEPTCTTDGATEGCSDPTCKNAVEPIAAKGHNYVTVGGFTTCNNGCSESKSDAMKFQLEVKSGSAVTATVYNDYSIEVVVPEGEVNASGVTVTATMKDVDSLSVEGTRSHEIKLTTGLTASPSLKTYLGNAFLNPYSAAVKINVNNGLAACEYVITGSGTGVITATTGKSVEEPDIAAARAVWQAIVNSDNVTSTTKSDNDSYFEISKDSYLIIDKERLEFVEKTGTFKLDNLDDSADTLINGIKDAVQLVESGRTTGIEMHLGAGSVLAVGNSVVKLNKSVTIVIDFEGANGLVLTFSEVDGSTEGVDILAKLRDTEALGSLLSIAVQTVNNMIGAINGETINVTVTIG